MMWRDEYVERSGLWIWFYLLLTLIVVWDLDRPVYRFFISSGVGERTGCQLDSFSEPSIAAAILKQEAERLFMDYARNRDQEIEAADFTCESSQHSLGQASSDEPDPWAEAARQAESRAGSILSLEHLSAEVRGLGCDLDQKLLVIHSDTRSWPGFLDHYLKLLGEAPENSFVVEWAWCALLHAHECGRTREVVEALEHAGQVNSSLKTARGLREVLERWSGQGTSQHESR